jgi:hypothetical protein
MYKNILWRIVLLAGYPLILFGMNYLWGYIWWDQNDRLRATILVIIGYPTILIFRWLFDMRDNIFYLINAILVILPFYYVIIRAAIGLFRKDKYAKVYRILALVVWGFGGWVMYMLQWT